MGTATTIFRVEVLPAGEIEILWQDALAAGSYSLDPPDITKGFYNSDDLSKNTGSLWHHGADPNGDWLYPPGPDLRPGPWHGGGFADGTGYMGNLARPGGQYPSGDMYVDGPVLGSRAASIHFRIPNDEAAWTGDAQSPPDNFQGPPYDWDYMLDGGKERRRCEIATGDASRPPSSSSSGLGLFEARLERWIAWATFLPADWDITAGHNDSVIHSMQFKDLSDGLPCFTVDLYQNRWAITHVSSPTLDVTWNTLEPGAYGRYGQSWYDQAGYADLLGDYAAGAESLAALNQVTLGGWTFWAVHFRLDHRPAGDGGEGFLDVYKRDQADDVWTPVLHITPRTQTIGGDSIARGVMCECTGYSSVYSRHGMYDVSPASSTGLARPMRQLFLGALVVCGANSDLDGIYRHLVG